jgi:hypothetical protein
MRDVPATIVKNAAGTSVDMPAAVTVAVPSVTITQVRVEVGS